MDFHDAFSEEVNPLFRRTHATRVADVEMPAHPLAVDRIEIFDRLLGRHDEIVPDVLDRDFHAGVPRHRNGLFDFHDGTLKTLLITHAVAGDTRNQQHARGAVGFRVLQTLHQSVETDFAGGFIGRRERLCPMGVATDTRGVQAGLLERREDLLAIHAAHWFHAVESRFFHDSELFEHRALHTDSGIHDRLAQIALRSG